MDKWGVDLRPPNGRPATFRGCYRGRWLNKVSLIFLFSCGSTDTRYRERVTKPPRATKTKASPKWKCLHQSGTDNIGRGNQHRAQNGGKGKRNRRETAEGDAKGQPATDQNHIPTQEAIGTNEFGPSPTAGSSTAPSDHSGPRATYITLICNWIPRHMAPLPRETVRKFERIPHLTTHWPMLRGIA